MLQQPRFLIRVVALCTAAASCLTPSFVAFSQSEDEATADARRLFHQGRAAMQAHRVETARMLLERAYELRPTPEIGFNLGLAELETGRFVPAARHIGLYVHQTQNPPPEVKRALAAAERNVAQLVFDVNVAGTLIRIDDEAIGSTPFLFQPIYVLAGRHTIAATCEGFESSVQVYDVEVGRRTDIRIVLDRKKEGVKELPPSASFLVDAGKANVAVSGRPGSSSAPPAIASAAPTAGVPSHLDTRTLVLGGGVALTLAAGVLAVVEGVRVSSADSDVRELSRTAATGGANGCVVAHTPECSQLAESIGRHDDALRLMRGAIIGGVVLGGATIATWFLWPRSTSTVHILPQVSSSTVGAVILGEIQ